MNITINDRECSAKPGDKLLDVARASHSHIGYFCGGNALCQTCYVKVLEGADLLSPLNAAERAMLSDALISEGTRMACQTTIERPGRISIISTVEEVKRMTLTNPIQIPGYMAKMGREAAVKFTDTIAVQARRDFEGLQVSPWQLLTDVIGGIGDAIQLVIDAVLSVFTPNPETGTPSAGIRENGRTPNGTDAHPAACCSGNGAPKIAPEALCRQEEDCVVCN
jgi:chlorosome envelope protein X